MHTRYRNMLVRTQVRRQCHAKNTDLVARHDSFSSEPQGRTGAPQIQLYDGDHTSTFCIPVTFRLVTHKPIYGGGKEAMSLNMP